MFYDFTNHICIMLVSRQPLYGNNLVNYGNQENIQSKPGKQEVKLATWDQRIFQVGNPIMHQAYCVASLNMKNLISPTPLNCARNAFTLALNDSADAFVRRLSK